MGITEPRLTPSNRGLPAETADAEALEVMTPALWRLQA